MKTLEWKLKPLASPITVEALSQDLNGLSPALSRALLLRGIATFSEARAFFRDSLEGLHDPASMRDMDLATARLKSAIESKERVVVYGDYDVDGTTSTAMLTHFLRSRGVPAAYFIPDRFRHGYGLSRSGLDEVHGLGASLVVAVDCGVTSVEEAEYTRSLGMELIVCDHHTPPEVLPNAVAVLDPKRPDCSYPFSELCGCGVAFKLITSVSQALGEPAGTVLEYLDLVALATAADVVPLYGENRVLLREGLNCLRAGGRLGIACLAEEARLDLASCTTRDIQFGLAPRINAAGRLGDAKRAVKLLLSEEDADARARARELERVNAERRAMDKGLEEDAVARGTALTEKSDRASLVLYDPAWHLGILGIAASRLAERFNLPTILLGQANDLAKGSARSTATVNIHKALSECSDLLDAFGGHDFAAGLSIRPSKLQDFSLRFDAAVREQQGSSTPTRVLAVDAPVNIADVDERFWAVLRQFEPFGEANPAPLFASGGLTVTDSPTLVGREGTHLKFRVEDPVGRQFPVIAFGLGERYDDVRAAWQADSQIEMVFAVDENNWKGRRTLQLKVKDFRTAGGGLTGNQTAIHLS